MLVGPVYVFNGWFYSNKLVWVVVGHYSRSDAIIKYYIFEHVEEDKSSKNGSQIILDYWSSIFHGLWYSCLFEIWARDWVRVYTHQGCNVSKMLDTCNLKRKIPSTCLSSHIRYRMSHTKSVLIKKYYTKSLF